jgi:hypothetical protein
MGVSQIILTQISAQIFPQKIWCDFFLLHNMHNQYKFPEIKGKYVELDLREPKGINTKSDGFFTVHFICKFSIEFP